MPFPACDRLIFTKNPLDEVICQLRFPPILSIDIEIPAKFQEAIRDEYPLYRETLEVKLNLPKSTKKAIPLELQELQSSGIKNYEFKSDDEKWKVNLTNNFIALSTSQYQRWEEFKRHLVKPLSALMEIYRPVRFTRIGLRYRDVIKRSALGLEDVPWSDLLRPYILGILTEPNVGKQIDGLSHTTEIRLADQKSIVRIADGLVEDVDTGEICYGIDSDFYVEGKIETSKAVDQLDFFNQRSSRLIQWCITERLRDAMEPQAI